MDVASVGDSTNRCAVTVNDVAIMEEVAEAQKVQEEEDVSWLSVVSSVATRESRVICDHWCGSCKPGDKVPTANNIDRSSA
jgi:hypothetical protein